MVLCLHAVLTAERFLAAPVPVVLQLGGVVDRPAQGLGQGLKSRQFILAGGHRHEVGVDVQRHWTSVADCDGPAMPLDLGGQLTGDGTERLKADGALMGQLARGSSL